MAGRRGCRKSPKILKPIDKASLGEATSHRAVTTVNAMWPRNACRKAWCWKAPVFLDRIVNRAVGLAALGASEAATGGRAYSSTKSAAAHKAAFTKAMNATVT